MDEKKAKRFVSFLKNKYGEDGAKKKIQKIQKTGKVDEEDLKEFLASELKQQQAQTQKALHGAKLNYFKSLKNQCAEDEEVVYYKKGGSVSCGCKKKEDGGPVKKDCGGSAIANFKAARKALNGMQTPEKNKNNKTIIVTKEQVKKAKELNNQEKRDPKYITTDSMESKKNISTKKESPVLKFKTAKKILCGSKLKKHLLGGSLNRIPFYLKGTVKLGIEKSDNTRVQKIPNNGEGVYEQIPMNGWDFVPLVGTYREAQRLDLGDPNASKLGFATSIGMDLLGAGMVGPAIKAITKASRLSKLLKSRGFNKITEQGLYRSQPNTYMKVAPETIKHLYYNVTQPTVRFKLVPTVDVSGIALSPLVQTLRVPTQAMAH